MVHCIDDVQLFDNVTREIVSEKMFKFRSFFLPIHGYVAASICIFGVVTNILHIVVLTRPSLRHTSVNCVLTAVAICDCGTMASYLTYLLYYILLPSTECDFSLSYGWVVFAVFHVMISIYLHSTSLWLCVALAFMRLMALRKTTLGSRWQTASLALRICGLICIIVLVLTLPNLLLQNIVTLQQPATECDMDAPNGTIDFFMVQLSPWARDNGCQMLKTNLLIVGGVFKIIPCLLLGLFSVLLIGKVKKHEKRKRKLKETVKNSSWSPTRRRRAPDRTTVMLISILLIFLFTELPQGLLTVGGGIYTEDIYFCIYAGIADVLDLLALLNSSVNFILYCLMSTQYRKTFLRVILPNKLSGRGRSGSLTLMYSRTEPEASSFQMVKSPSSPVPSNHELLPLKVTYTEVNSEVHL